MRLLLLSAVLLGGLAISCDTENDDVIGKASPIPPSPVRSSPIPLSPVGPSPSSTCHSSYQGGSDATRGGCIRGGESDYDCWQGGNPGGNGPYYAAGPLQVVGPDTYRLDSDSDGIGCENG